MCRGLKRLGLTKKKRRLGSQAATDRVQKLREKYSEKVKNVEPENLVFLSGNGGFTWCDEELCKASLMVVEYAI